MSAEHLPIELLSARLDGETTAEELARIEAHLATCAACRSELEDLRRIARATAALAVPEVPEGLRTRIGAAVAPAAPRRRAWIGAAASIAAAGLVATAWFLQGPAPIREPAPPASAPVPPVVDAVGDTAGNAAAVEGGASPPAAAKAQASRAKETRLRPVEAERRGVAPPPPPPPAMPKSEMDETRAAQPMAKLAAPEVMGGIAAEAYDFVPYVEVDAAGPVDAAALVRALNRERATARTSEDGRTIEAEFAPDQWPACRAVFAEAGIRIDEDKVHALPGDRIGIRVRVPEP